MMKIRTAIAFLALLHCSASAHAVVTFEWVLVGHPGNGSDQLYASNNPTNLRFGSVASRYSISKHEVTNDQYTEFLNAVDFVGTNPNSVYSPLMGSDQLGGIAFNSGAASGAKYSIKTNMGNKPVNYVSFFDAMRFVNWLENGQPANGSGTESGVYIIGNGANETRAAGSTFFIPSEDEWYKAAYYQPSAQGGDTDSYWFYPAASNSVPVVATANALGDISNPGTNVANYFRGADWNGQDGNVTTVGSAGPMSTSYYGTLDQGGNVWEWNEAVIQSALRCLRGGHWSGNSDALSASLRNAEDPARGNRIIGFRIASVPEPRLGWLGLLVGAPFVVNLCRVLFR